MTDDCFEYIPTSTDEIEASLNYLNEKSAAIGKLLDSMHRFAMDLDRWGVSNQKFYSLHTHLCDELLRTETDRSLCEADLRQERGREQKTIMQ
jgi:K+/H+ antiporter YhaU regulatory subunit KhtT